MRRSAALLLGGIFLAFVIVGFTTAPLHALDYVESSQGLGNPAWESGRTEVEMADLNLDGNIDLITIGDHGSPFINTQEHGIAVYFGNGEGRWTVYQNGNFGYGGIAVGDVNNDGLPDVGYAMHHDYSSTDFGDQLIEVALGDGTGQNWTPWDDNLATAGETYGMFATDLGDIDNDGDLDIVATSFGAGNPLQVYLNNYNGTWTHSQAVTPGPNNAMHVVFGDINKDGNLDIATAYQSGTVFFGYGNGQFYSADYNLPPGSGSYNRNGVALGDVDNDGGMDLSWVSSSGLHVWAFNEATTSWVDFTGNLPQTGISGYSQLWDMDGDGFCDVAVGGSGQIGVWTGNGAGNWTLAANLSPGWTFQAFRVGGDVDHNGFPDLVQEGSGQPHCLKETSIATSLTIFPYFPKGGELFKSGSVRFIDWISAVPAGDSCSVALELSTTGAAGPWAFITQNRPNNGRHQWPIPTVTTSSNCYLRLSVTSGTTSVSATTAAPFTILNGAPNVAVSLEPINPPIVIPATGGSFDYTISLTNNESSPLPCQVWINVTLPGGSTYGPLLNVPLTAPVGTLSRTKTQSVPANAPAGNYTYNAYVGIYPNTVWSSNSFPFTKLGVGDWGLGVGEWSNTGETFAQDINLREELISSPLFLLTCSPNPFNTSTAIRYQIPDARPVSLQVYDTAGRLVVTLVDGWLGAGEHQVTFEGAELASGVYLYRLQVGDITAIEKMVLLK